jgi:hypothetical protein
VVVVQFTATHTYKHRVGEVFEILTDFDAVRAKYEALGDSNVDLVRRDEGEDGSVTLVTRRVVPLELPGFAKRVLSPKQSVTQTDEWSAADAKGGRTGTFAVEAKGTPVRVHGSLRLAPKGTKGCTNTLAVTVECKLPLIGGKIADLVAKDTRRAVDHEQEWTSARLEGAGGPAG